MAQPQIRTRPMSDLKVPEVFGRLRDISYNLWWTWSLPAHRVFNRLASETWRHYRNPVDVLIDLGSEHWRMVENDDSFARDYHVLVEQFDAYISPPEPTWFDRTHGDYRGGPFAYFSMEYGWHECLQTYSGGLGVLSGDHSKSASDLGLPFVGIGLMYKHGYFRQTINADGLQQHHYPEYDLRRLPLLPVVDANGSELHVPVDLPGRSVQLRVWRALVGRVPVLLLDSDLPINDPADRPITSILYVGKREMRLCQELLLGLGGVRVLTALGIEPGAWHLNEGHSALLTLERIGAAIEQGADFDAALRQISTRTVFTTHTPVPAGNEIFDAGLVRGYLTQSERTARIDTERVMNLGRPADEGGHESFNLTALALRTSIRANGVSELHGRVANDMWRPLIEGSGLRSIEHVTNGVHLATWIGPEIGKLLFEHVGPAFDDPRAATSFAEAVESIPDHALWSAHLAQKQRFIAMTRDKTLEQFARHGRSPAELREIEQLLDPDALTVAFARRFATYKRADLLLRDEKRLRALVGNDDRPVQLVFSGKAHPADQPGQDLIRRISQAALSPDLRRRLVFIENYDMRIARHLVQGVDLWLNTPRRRHEASGTSGMKAAINGVLNCSILDGWWCEGYDPSHGWVIGGADEGGDEAARDQEDTESLLSVLGGEISQAFYDRNEQGLPVGWIRRMKRALADLTPRFSASRMAREYTERFYLPAARGELD